MHGIEITMPRKSFGKVSQTVKLINSRNMDWKVLPTRYILVVIIESRKPKVHSPLLSKRSLLGERLQIGCGVSP